MRTVGLGLLTALFLALGVQTSTAFTWLVKPDGTGDRPTIQDAIAAASPGDTVALGDGVFRGAGNRDVTFLGKAITLRSVSGDPERSVVDAEGTQYNPRRCFSIQTGEGPGTVIESVTLRGGWLGLPVSGAGILCMGSSPTIRNCIFTANHGWWGAGLAVGAGAHPVVSDCLFSGNDCSEDGAGIGSVFDDPGSVTALHCWFQDNVVNFHGGAVAVRAPSLISDCVFLRNRAGNGGGFYHCGEGRTEFEACTFFDNSSYLGGAGIS